MANDVFARTTEIGGAMSSDATRLNFTDVEGIGQTGLILQNVEIQFSQNVSRLYALENGKVYFVAGPTEGGIGATNVVGPNGIAKAFYEKYGNVCDLAVNPQGRVFNISVTRGCVGQNQQRSSLSLKQPVLSSINIRLQATDMIIFAGFQATFVKMEIVQP